MTSFNPINKTYTKVSYAIMFPDSTTNATINGTERGNLTFNLQPNGIAIVEGKSLLVAKGGEKAAALLNGIRRDDPRTSAGVAFLAQTLLGS